MANSMTAFARSELSTDQGNLAWELRSVNHRYLEVTLRLPEAFRELEGPLRELLRKQVARGKVECTLRFNPAEQQSSELSLNQPLLDQLIRTTEQLGTRLHNAGPINPLELLAQKIDVAEELDRLDTHVVETRRVLDSKDAIGRRLDFLMQEFNREANTLGSKAIDTRSTQAAVDLKVFIEQMREQIQNIE
jgi:uncharacterized protein YicC (UPF0701 family)